ncbi:MAG TPA: VOC family protein [Sphingobium sp.]|uniref:VOC family protein n=1 Tax=Sphingobium sp. TaxID=1912891 RepID=UPI002ED4FB54
MLNIGRYGTRDLEKAKVFYDAIAGILGASRVTDTPRVVGYRGPEGGMFLVGTPFEGEATAGNGTQLGFQVASRDIVDALHTKALELGGKSEGAPGERGPEDYRFYACYFRDLDGNKLNAITTAK